MREKIRIILIILGINFLLTTILGLLNEYNVVSYAFGICAMGISNVVLDMGLNK
jgi:hypothetical protein